MSAPPAPLCVQGIAASRVVISSFLSRHSAAAARDDHALTHSDGILLKATFKLLITQMHYQFSLAFLGTQGFTQVVQSLSCSVCHLEW